MQGKVILISIDGMRPDGFLQCGSPFAERLMSLGAYTLEGRSVFPPVTLPVHTSIFHSVTPQRHGITTNIFVPFARPVNGLFEQIKAAGGKSAMFYGWEQMRDVSRPGSLSWSEYVSVYLNDFNGKTDDDLTRRAIERINESKPDFVFLYLPETDEEGHAVGWMTGPYLALIKNALENVRRVLEACGEEYTVIVTADHGGHDRSHGQDIPEDMTVPMFFIGPRFTPGKALSNVSVLDIAPTAADILGVCPAPEWEGRSLAE